MLRTFPLALLTALCLGVPAALVSLLLTRALLKLLPQWGMVDRPDFKRHIHTAAVPRGGGLGMILAFAGVLTAFFGFILPGDAIAFREFLRFLAPLAILVPLGLIDDRRGLRAGTKFLFQTVAAVLAWSLGFRLDALFGLNLAEWACLPLTILWIVGFINAFNMIDGVDGLAAGVGIISAVCMAVVAFSQAHHGFAAVLLTFAFSALGFLFYNWNPARVFMGDTGSMFIGYVLAVAGLVLNARLATAASIGIPLLACGIPILDMLFAVWRRILGFPDSTASPNAFPPPPPDEDEGADAAGRKPSGLKRLARLAARLGTADQRHLHHRLLGYFNRNQRKTVWSIYLLAMGMGVAAIACCFFPQNKVTFTLVILLCTFGFIINRLAFIELWQTTELAYHNFQSAHAGVIITYILNPLADLAVIVFSYYFAAQHTYLAATYTLRYVAILMAVLLTSRPYRVFWNFAVSDDYFRLIRTLFYGFILARASDVVLPCHHVTRLHSYAACVAVSLIMLERLGLHYLRNWRVRSFWHSFLNRATGERVLLVGISQVTRFYRNRLLGDIEHAGAEELVGVIDRERRFRHSYCFGLKVLGNFDDLPAIVRDHRVSRIVVTAPLTDDERAALDGFCRANNLPVKTVTYQED